MVVFRRQVETLIDVTAGDTMRTTVWSSGRSYSIPNPHHRGPLHTNVITNTFITLQPSTNTTFQRIHQEPGLIQQQDLDRPGAGSYKFSSISQSSRVSGTPAPVLGGEEVTEFTYRLFQQVCPDQTWTRSNAGGMLLCRRGRLLFVSLCGDALVQAARGHIGPGPPRGLPWSLGVLR